MKMKKLGQVQIGKNKVSENFIETLKTHFKNHENMRVSVLRGAGADKKKVKEYSEEILSGLGKNYTSKIVGFTIFIKKWRKPKR